MWRATAAAAPLFGDFLRMAPPYHSSTTGRAKAFALIQAVFKLSQFQYGGYECFGDGYMLLFRRAGRD